MLILTSSASYSKPKLWSTASAKVRLTRVFFGLSNQFVNGMTGFTTFSLITVFILLRPSSGFDYSVLCEGTVGHMLFGF